MTQGSHLLGQTWTSQNQKMGHLQYLYGLYMPLLASVQVLGRFSSQTYCRHKSRHADQHLLVLQVSALLSGDQKDLEMEFGRFGRTLGCSAPCSLLSREQLTRRNCGLLRGAHCCVDLINLPNNVSVERQNLCWRSAVWLLVDARLKVYKLHRESCGLREKLWIWRDWGCSVSPEWCYCQTGIWRCGCCKQVRSTETQVSLPMWTVLLGCK